MDGHGSRGGWGAGGVDCAPGRVVGGEPRWVGLEITSNPARSLAHEHKSGESSTTGNPQEACTFRKREVLSISVANAGRLLARLGWDLGAIDLQAPSALI